MWFLPVKGLGYKIYYKRGQVCNDPSEIGSQAELTPMLACLTQHLSNQAFWDVVARTGFELTVLITDVNHLTQLRTIFISLLSAFLLFQPGL